MGLSRSLACNRQGGKTISSLNRFNKSHGSRSYNTGSDCGVRLYQQLIDAGPF